MFASACASASDDASPHVVTTGGNSFPSNTTEKTISIPKISPCSTQQLAHIDWLGFTINIADLGDSDPLLWFILEFHELSGFFTYDDNRKGWMGYKFSRDIEQGCGKLAWGGEHQKNTLHVELTGKGCAAITDWPKLREWLERMEAKITRVDIAHDDHEGKTINLELCKKWLDDGLFSLGKREPDRRMIDDLGTGKGCTLYVGGRKNGKMFRGYQKGKQLGDKLSNWFRAEVEWRAKDRFIPLDVLTSPGVYLAGSYPALAFISVVQDRIKTMKKAVELTIFQAVSNAKQAVGKLLNVLCNDLKWPLEDIFKTLQREGTPARLKPFDRFLSLAAVT